jgi:hypothetical protein
MVVFPQEQDFLFQLGNPFRYRHPPSVRISRLLGLLGVV